MSQLPKNLFEDNVIRPRSLFTKVYGLNFITKSRSLLFDKKFGVPGKYDWSTPRIRRFERPAHSRRKHISIVQKFNDCLLLTKMRSIVESSYRLGSEVQDMVKLFLEKKKKAKTYHYVRTILGLPCRGQRTKTNARTAKKYKLGTTEAMSFLKLVASHQSESLLQYAKHLSAKRADMLKFRMIQDLMHQRRYKPKSGQTNSSEHYDQVYQDVVSSKKRKKNYNIKRK